MGFFGDCCLIWGMEFSKDLWDVVLVGDVIVMIWLWSCLKVKVGGRYWVGLGWIEVDIVEWLVFVEIDEMDFDCCGEVDLEVLWRCMVYVGLVYDDMFVYCVVFHVVDDEVTEGRLYGDADGCVWVVGLLDVLDG